MTHSRASSGADSEALPWRRRRARDAGAFVSPAVRNASIARGLDPRGLTGSGVDGRVTRADVIAAAVVGGGPAPAGDEVVPFNNVRRHAAVALLASTQTSPQALAVVAVDYTGVERVRSGARLTALPFVARSVIDALREFPSCNASVDGDALVLHRRVHLGIAVDLAFEGLVVPVVRDADGMRLPSLAASIRDVAARARAKQLGPDDLAGGTFTITNPGASGTWISFPILNAPQVGILSTDGVAKRLVVDEDGRLRVAPVGNLCLTFDHRALDGAYAGAFLERVRDIVEHRNWAAEL